MASFLYDSFREYIADGTIDVDDDTFKVALLSDTHTPSAAHTTFADVAADEISGTGYTAGGATLQNVTWTRSGSVATFSASDPVWIDATFDAGYAVVYDATSANNVLVCIIDFGGNKYVSEGRFTVSLNADGLFRLV